MERLIKKIQRQVLKLFCTYLLFIALLMQSFYRGMLTLDYELNLPEYLAKCINKDRPELNCNGQCVLMQRIKSKEKEETKKNMVIYEYSSHYIHKEYSSLPTFQIFEEIIEKPFSAYRIAYSYHYQGSIFRPPLS